MIQVRLNIFGFCLQIYTTVPSGAPQNLAIINSNSTSVTISWDGIDCIHRNGMITHYLIVNGPVDEANQMTNVSVNSNRPDNGGSYTTTGLDATQNYIFKVAAVNSDGVGVFATVSTNKRKLHTFSLDIHYTE